MGYEYHPQVLAALASFGLQPTTSTPPALAHEFVSDLYRFELRRLRRRFVDGDIAKSDYSPQVVELRRKYFLISIPVSRWARVLPERP